MEMWLRNKPFNPERLPWWKFDQIINEFCSIDGYTFVPDDNFEQALIDLGYDDILDNFVVTENISGVTELNVG